MLREQDQESNKLRQEMEHSQAETDEAMMKLQKEHNKEITEARSRWHSTLSRLKVDKEEAGQDTELVSQLEVTQHQVNTLAQLNFESSEKLKKLEAELLENRRHGEQIDSELYLFTHTHKQTNKTGAAKAKRENYDLKTKFETARSKYESELKSTQQKHKTCPDDVRRRPTWSREYRNSIKSNFVV